MKAATQKRSGAATKAERYAREAEEWAEGDGRAVAEPLRRFAAELRSASAQARAGHKAMTALRSLSDTVLVFLVALDREMAQPSSAERGARVSKLSNALELRNDIVRRFTLGLGITAADKAKAVRNLGKKEAP